MQLTNTPGKLVLPFANAGAKNTIPTASQIGITAGAASLVDGFPPLTRTPIAAGGVPPSGLDMNGILYNLSAILRWANAGGGYAYDAAFATDSNVGGYPKGARIMRSDGLGYWFNTVENNTTDPEAAGAAAAGWVPDFTNGVTAVTMTSANVTLTPLQYGKPIIVITGTLTANLSLIFPTIVNEWTVINNTTGAFTITCKTASGSGVVAPQSAASIVYGDATNIGGLLYAPLTSPAFTGTPTAPTPAQFDNDTSLATTAFVQRALGSLSACKSIGASQALTADDAGKLIQLSTGVAHTVTLPATSTVPDGTSFTFVNTGSGHGTIQRVGADIISTNGAAINSFLLGAGDFAVLVKYSAAWLLFGSVSLPDSPLFAKSLAESGYQRLPSALIVQWGTVSVGADTTASVTWPIAFPTGALQAVVSQGTAISVVTDADCAIYSLTSSGATVTNGLNASATLRYIAIGY